MNNKAILWVVVLVVVIGGAKLGYDVLNKQKMQSQNEVTASTEKEEADNSVSENEKIKAPEFIVTDKDGNHVKFSDFAGKPVVINFWATWCVYCREEMPDFQAVYDEYKDTDLQILMINASDSRTETRENVEKFLKEHNISMPIFYDEAILGVDGLKLQDSAQAVYGVASYPSTVFIDRDGNISGAKVGLITKEAILSELSKIV